MKKQLLVYIPETVLNRNKMIHVMKEVIDTVIELKPSDFNQSLGYLSHREGFSMNLDEVKHQDYIESILIMDQLEDEQINLLLSKLREAQVPFVGPKAIVTQHNQTWSIDALYFELMKEHEFFAYYDLIQDCLKRANNEKKEDYESNSWNEYQKAFLNAYMLIKSEMPELEILKTTYENLIMKEEQLVKISNKI
ncbi:MAG: DUF3783 domain-containing protein [Erysipelotrichaceae bacterium]